MRLAACFLSIEYIWHVFLSFYIFTDFYATFGSKVQGGLELTHYAELTLALNLQQFSCLCLLGARITDVNHIQLRVLLLL